MKLESHLPRGAGPLHLAPMLDVVMLLIIFILIGGSFVLHSGVVVDLPVSESRVPIESDAYVVTVSPPSVEGTRITFNGKSVTREELEKSLETGREHSRQLVLMGDENATLKHLLPVMALADSFGYEVLLATRSSGEAGFQ